MENVNSQKIRVCYNLVDSIREKGYMVLLPYDVKNNADNAKYPVLYLCHGTGGVYEWTDVSRGNIKKIMDEMVNNYGVTPMIVVMPLISRRGTSDEFMQYLNTLKSTIIPDINKEFRVKEGKKNAAIAGFSMGGSAALYYATQLKDTFSYVGGFSPSHCLLPIPNETKSGWLSKEADFTLNTGRDSLNLIGYGTREQTFKVYSDYYISVLHKNGIDVNNHGEDITVVGGYHGFETFNELLKRFLKTDFFRDSFGK